MKRYAAVALITLAAAACRSSEPAAKAKSESEPVTASGQVRVDAARQRQAGIVVEEVRQREVAETITAPGQLGVNEERTWRVGAISGGRVVEVLANVGDTVRRGQVLARLYSDDVHEARAAWRRADTELRRAISAEQHAARVRDRAVRLFTLRAASREQVESAEAELQNARSAVSQARTDLEKEREHVVEYLGLELDTPTGAHTPESHYISVRAPASGLVTQREITDGSVVSAGQHAYTITDPSTLWMTAAVNEADFAAVRAGAVARVFVRAWPDEPFKGRVLRVGEQLDATTRTLKVRIALSNADGRLRPEMYATVELARPRSREALYVPAAAIQEVQGSKVVFVERAGTFELRAVNTGHQASGDVEVTAGLRAGERVAVRGAFTIKSQMLAGSMGEE